MRQRLISALAGALVGTGAGTCPAQEPRTVAFVVGVEKYTERHLDQLKFVAEDAKTVWEALKNLTGFDESRSKALIGDARTFDGAPAAVTQGVARDTILNEFEEFLAKVQDRELVVIYMGGHGAVRRGTKEVSFLPSDFVSRTFTRNIFMSDIMRGVSSRLADKVDVRVVVFANMCHAAALPAGHQGDEQRLSLEEFKRLSEQYTMGVARRAYIPAAQPDEPAYESDALKASVYARHLLDALTGAAAEGNANITTGSVLQYLQAHISPAPPELDGFDRTIVLGHTRTEEASYRYWLGIGLLAASLDRGDDPHLLRLAVRQFERSAALATTGRGRSLLAAAQARVLLGDGIDAASELLTKCLRQSSDDPVVSTGAGAAGGDERAVVGTISRRGRVVHGVHCHSPEGPGGGCACLGGSAQSRPLRQSVSLVTDAKNDLVPLMRAKIREFVETSPTDAT